MLIFVIYMMSVVDEDEQEHGDEEEDLNLSLSILLAPFKSMNLGFVTWS